MKHLKISNSKWVVKHLPALAAAVAVTLALAFTPRTVDDGFAIDPANPTGPMIDLTEWQLGTHYECNTSQEVCTYSDNQGNNPLEEDATFVILQRPSE